MKRIGLLAGLAALVLAAGSSWADPAADSWLALIRSALQEVTSVRIAVQDGLEGSILGIESDAFPGSPETATGVYRDMSLLAQELVTLRADVLRLSCGWRFTARTALLQRSLLEPVHFCKPSFQAAWGIGSGFTRDLDELHDAVSSLGLNVLSSRSDAEDASWAPAWASLQESAGHLRRSPGEANRDEAVALSGADLMAGQDARLRATKILVEANDRDLDRFLERKEADFATAILAGLRGSLPPPSEKEN